MALFLDTQSISKEILQIIKEAKKRVVLVSPYFQTSGLIRERIRTKGEKSNLTEFTIIYGKGDLKATEYNWMKEIKNLVVLEKINLHAKCYLNESRAVICSMNLYEYSQQNNIEMGILITRKEDPVAFHALMDEIENLKHNGLRKIDNRPNTYEKLAFNQKLKYILINELVGYRLNGDRDEEFEILTTSELISLASSEILNAQTLSKLLPEKKSAEYCEGILQKMDYAQKFTLGTILKVIQNTRFKYPKIVFKPFDSDEILLSCTEDNLPVENIIVAAKIKGDWFNSWYYLE
jgi:hypothetical protein